MAPNTDSSSDSSTNVSREQSPLEDPTTNTSVTSETNESIHGVDERKQPWRSLPEFKNVKDDVSVKNQRDMRLFGNHVNAHS